MVNPLAATGWALFQPEPAVRDWAAAVRDVALARAADPGEQARWLGCEGTWFVGVDSLPNDAKAAVTGSGPLGGAALGTAQALYGALPLHRGQVSVVYPGYPRPRDGEAASAFRYRLRRDAAHVDGLLPMGADRRRHLRERHAFILGLPLTDADAGASPLVLWQGSHHLMRRAFARALDGIAPGDWAGVDLTGPYQAARREVFETCRRVVVHARPGGACLVHRLCLHGVAPWAKGARAAPEGRVIVYFRPEFADDTRDDWLLAP